MVNKTARKLHMHSDGLTISISSNLSQGTGKTLHCIQTKKLYTMRKYSKGRKEILTIFVKVFPLCTAFRKTGQFQ